jgi:hypothetical protein
MPTLVRACLALLGCVATPMAQQPGAELPGAPQPGAQQSAAEQPGAQQPVPPHTVPERTGYARTSRLAEVEAFCAALSTLPHGERVTLREAGRSHEGRPLLLARIALPGAEAPLCALAIGDIHAGEVAGKEALLQLLREFASGEHTALLRHVECWFLPVYNVDGNEAIGTGNRPGQKGPPQVGGRQNAQGLDLNRDLVKVDAPETRALLSLFRDLDPHLFVDLHTTNGSYHGYHLTYSPSVCTNVDSEVASLNRSLLDDVQKSMRDEHGYATFDYGNFGTNDWDGGGAPKSDAGTRGWFTFDHRARYATNYYGLRNRISALGEAYSYCDFATRIAACRAYVLCLLSALAERREEVVRVCAEADARLAGAPQQFGFDTVFGEPESLEVLVGEVDRIEQEGQPPLLVRKGDGVPERMPVVRSFRARKHRELPQAWAIPAPSAPVLDRLRWHGVSFETLDAPREVRVRRFAIGSQRRPRRPFQGHQEVELQGEWREAESVGLPRGAVIVSARQPLSRLAATLLEPESEDSLATWNFFDDAIGEHFPVLRLVD